ncbi:GNAT family N-acetyltransferase [Tepidibacter thalassicus]|uniref:Ribosomal-protein-alanine N-acetyltransferase n=1 Tax=Tepidibacter thalassicus DSM 15285 TaxID=1123350 RepID=A0A1M5SZC2_9FIRM|nr:GNAT family protein [Tepidibacter thalassicus]SHH43513.1 ribosomal-protein-alanine N-acetyltransferase [Tepidibacter thalassicus DSM 15285]
MSKMKKILVRQVEMSDAEQLLNVIPTIDRETEFMIRSRDEFSLSLDQEQKFIASKMNNPKDLFLIALFGDKIVGSLVFSGSTLKKYSHFGEFGMGILKDYWGMGIGTMLLEELIVWAKQNEIHKINLKVVESNERAIRLYEKFQFVYEGTIENGVLINDTYSRLLIMGRTI